MLVLREGKDTEISGWVESGDIHVPVPMYSRICPATYATKTNLAAQRSKEDMAITGS